MIKFVYFDVGGVVIKDFSDSKKWEVMLSDLGLDAQGVKRFDDLYKDNKSRINLDYDFDNLVPKLRSEFDLRLPDDYSLLDELISRFEPNYGLMPIYSRLQKQAELGLLTNMWVRMFDKLVETKLIPDIPWNTIVDSTSVNMAKPDQDIYKYAQTQAGVQPTEILFIDNSPQNLTIPQNLGWVTFHYDSSNYDQATQNLSKYLDQLDL